MARVERHPLDDRLGFDFEPLDWQSRGTSRKRAQDEASDYEIAVDAPLRFTITMRGDARRIYTVRLGPGGNRGWCSCPGFIFHVKAGKGPCVHLWLAHFHTE